MLKLNASYSKKVPAEGNYSSQSYHVSLEVELPDAITEKELKSKIAETFDLARQSVETELNPTQQISDVEKELSAEAQPLASDKQVAYLNTLIKQNGLSVDKILFRYGHHSLNELSRKECTSLISELKSA